jgi:hypothetical protein
VSIGGSVTSKRPEFQSCEDAEQGAPPTARPEFDPAKFARESDAKIRAAIEAPISRMPTVRPPESLADVLAFPDETRAAADSIPDVEEVPSNGGAQDALGVDAVPCMARSREDLARSELTPGAARLLSYVNGIASLEAICGKAKITTEEGASLMLDLAEQGIVSFR